MTRAPIEYADSRPHAACVQLRLQHSHNIAVYRVCPLFLSLSRILIESYTQAWMMQPNMPVFNFEYGNMPESHQPTPNRRSYESDAATRTSKQLPQQMKVLFFTRAVFVGVVVVVVCCVRCSISQCVLNSIWPNPFVQATSTISHAALGNLCSALIHRSASSEVRAHTKRTGFL